MQASNPGDEEREKRRKEKKKMLARVEGE